MSRPRIGITSWPRPIAIGSVQEPNETVPRAYVRSVVKAGGLPILLPVLGSESIDDVLDTVDGIVVAGGGDVDPLSYGEELAPETTDVDAERDAFDIALWRAIIEHNVPTLGVCRGMQILNVALGGTLVQHVEGHRGGGHGIRFTDGRHVEVNSLHHQAIDRLGDGLTAIAHADDGVVEAVTIDGLLAVQWHPELLRHEPAHLALFGQVVERAS
jgi:putative glutamine amidotransferase